MRWRLGDQQCVLLLLWCIDIYSKKGLFLLFESESGHKTIHSTGNNIHFPTVFFSFVVYFSSILFLHVYKDACQCFLNNSACYSYQYNVVQLQTLNFHTGFSEIPSKCWFLSDVSSFSYWLCMCDLSSTVLLSRDLNPVMTAHAQAWWGFPEVGGSTGGPQAEQEESRKQGEASHSPAGTKHTHTRAGGKRQGVQHASDWFDLILWDGPTCFCGRLRRSSPWQKVWKKLPHPLSCLSFFLSFLRKLHWVTVVLLTHCGGVKGRASLCWCNIRM